MSKQIGDIDKLMSIHCEKMKKSEWFVNSIKWKKWWNRLSHLRSIKVKEKKYYFI
jgi:hypothetical protein